MREVTTTELIRETDRLKRLNESLAERVAAQSELLSRKAERGETYTIKPLEWVRRPGAGWVADTIFGRLYVDVIYGLPRWTHPDATWIECESIEVGKELAWEWYRAKLGEALTRVDTQGRGDGT